VTISKENPNALPQIDAQYEFDDTPEYANQILDKLLEDGFTLTQVAAHTGICRRSLSYMRQRGIRSFPYQIALEIMAGERTLNA
jgi:hypothetical protein